MNGRGPSMILIIIASYIHNTIMSIIGTIYHTVTSKNVSVSFTAH